jgi:hypothetical protein
MLPHANHSRVERVNGNRVYDGMACDGMVGKVGMVCDVDEY